MTPPLVIFDIGDTLVTGPSQGPARRIADLAGLAEQAIDGMQHLLMTTDCSGPDEAADALLSITRADPSGLRAAVHEVWNDQRSEAHPLPGAIEALEQLVANDVRLALLSDIWPPYLESVRAGYGGLFDRHIPRPLQLFSFQEGHRKPSMPLVGRLLERAGATPATAVMVGDSLRKDITPAISLGLGTVLVRPGHASRDERPLASRTVDAVADIHPGLIWSILETTDRRDGQCDS